MNYAPVTIRNFGKTVMENKRLINKMESLSNIAYKTLLGVLLMSFCLSASAQAPGETITTVADKGTSGMYLAKFCPTSDICFDRQEEMFPYSLYINETTSEGIFSALRARAGGKYIVRAGEHVIVKTKEPVDIIIEEYTGTQKSVYDDEAYSPVEDIYVSDFIATYGLTDGEYIYMLTNMEKNGGFGFTHFTGSTMKKGNFYIVSTREPETTGIKAVSSTVASIEGAVYNLQGMRVLNPVEGQIYIQNGRKFVKRNNATSASSLEQPSIIAPVVTRAVKDIEDGDPVPILPGEAGDDDGF